MGTLFLTGFPGFLGSRLLPRVLARAPEDLAVCLVQPRFLAMARRRVDELESHNRALAHRIEIISEIARATRRRILRFGLPLALAKAAIDRVPGVYRVMGIPSASIDYFIHPTTYATDQAQADLEGSGLSVPPFSSYVDRLVEFVRAHPEIGSDAMA